MLKNLFLKRGEARKKGSWEVLLSLSFHLISSSPNNALFPSKHTLTAPSPSCRSYSQSLWICLYKWNHTEFVLVRLVYFVKCNVRVCPCCNVSEFPSFLKLNNIPLRGWTMICLSSPINGHLASFTSWLLWIMLLWTGVFKPLFDTLLSVLLGVYLEMKCWIIWKFLFNFFDGSEFLA